MDSVHPEERATWEARVRQAAGAIRDLATECPDCWDGDLLSCPRCEALWHLGKAVDAVVSQSLPTQTPVDPPAMVNVFAPKPSCPWTDLGGEA